MNTTRHHGWRMIVLAAAITLAAAPLPLHAVHPQAWTHQSQKDFTEGDFENLVVTTFGELTLGRELTPLKITGAAAADLEQVTSFAQTPDGAIYAGTIGKGKIYRLKDGQATEYFTTPATSNQITSLAVDAHGRLLVAAGGETATVLQLEPGPDGKITSKTVLTDEHLTQIWALQPTPDGAVYAATGPKGQVWKIAPDGKTSVALETGAKNALALAADNKGNLLIGTAGNGLVLRGNPTTGKMFVLLDAGPVDVTALVTDETGTLYAATATPEDTAGGNTEELEGGPKAKPGELLPETPDLNDDAGLETKPKDKTTPKTPAKKPAATKDTPNLDGQGMIHLPEPGSMLLGQARPPTGMELPPELRALLQKAKQQRDAKSGPGPATGKKSPMPPMHGPKKTTHAGPKMSPSDLEPEDGNAVYKITPDGTVTTLHRGSDMNYSLVYQHGELLIGTGQEGKLYACSTKQPGETLLARVRDENVGTLFAAADGTVYVGTANNGAIYTLGAVPAPHGTFTSTVLDAGHTATWGTASLRGTVPAAAHATLAVRTGNVRDVKKNEQFWSPWSDEIPAGDGQKIAADPGRFLQYRVTLTGAEKTAAPVVEQVRVAYQVQNLPPKIKNLTAEVDTNADEGDLGAKPDENGPLKIVHISWDATDPNKDELTYRVLYRELGKEPPVWIQLAKDLKESIYSWNVRSIPDGKYQIEVIASDASDNPPAQALSVAEMTGPITVDNTPPTLSDLKTVVDGGKIVITGVAKDALSPVTDVRYQVDSAVDWQPAVASDKIFDSPSETFGIVTKALPAGNHRVTIKATDAQGNVSAQAVNVTVQ